MNNALILVDEFQNCNYHELCSVMTRIGKNSKIYFAGDGDQSDFEYEKERNGIIDFMDILDTLKYFKKIQFDWADCVRSGIVRDFLMSQQMIKERKKLN
jgi:phosphate starvation-inducible protein PhoH